MHLALEAAQHVANLAVGESLHLGLEQQIAGQCAKLVLFEATLGAHEVFDFAQEPHVDFGDVVNLAKRNPHLHRVVENKHAVPAGVLELMQNHLLIG